MHTLITEPEDSMKASAAWALGQVGRHTSDHAKALTDAGALPKLLMINLHEFASDDPQQKSKDALIAIISKCTYLPALEPLLNESPPEILECILGQYAKVLPSDVKLRKQFMVCGGLKFIQELDAEPGTTIKEVVDIINTYYPQEVIRYFTPAYFDELLQKVEEYTP
ncbi:MAG: hypothetical protein EZS28_011742 [Streblomastix strix]|uniref:Sperm-associated antigen 6 n=1 Tax=Streblomastix strix TaxID=222440 RepID=A0A5J4WDZ3_9EUKA|nr:MAG: hypothetical protein EZS28_011742 [Streblomastix strix]